MTCIVAVAENGKVCMGGDSAGVSGWDITVRADKKVFKREHMAFGFTTSFRMGNILRYRLKIPHRKDKPLEEYMYTDFIDSVRKAFKENGYMHVSENRETGGNFLVGVEGRIFNIQSDLQIAESVEPYDSVGAGYPYSLGYLYKNTDGTPKQRVKGALEAAVYFSAAVRPPFHYVTV